MRYVTVSEARAVIPGLSESATSTVLTKNGQPVAVLMPIQEYRAMRAMLRLAEQPQTAARVAAAHRKVAKGELDDFDEIADMEVTHARPAVRQD